jgi:predicted flap endonuclease-1-like 5' DNA nuclease
VEKREPEPMGLSALPAGIGRPATRALLGAGITSLEQVAARTEAQLLTLHGLGPRAIQILKVHLSARNLALRKPAG